MNFIGNERMLSCGVVEEGRIPSYIFVPFNVLEGSFFFLERDVWGF